MDGWVTIGTELDTKQLEKDIREAERELKIFEREAESLTKKKARLEIDTKNSEKNIEILNNKIEQSYSKLTQEKQKLASIPTWKQESPEYMKQVEAVNRIKTSYDNLLIKHDVALGKIQRQEEELKNIDVKMKENTNQQGLLNNKIQEMNNKLKITQFGNIGATISGIGAKIGGVVKSVGRWALAIFSVRSAYNLVTQAVSTLSNYNKQLATDVQYIQYALATALQPIVEFLIQLVYKVLSLINSIAKAFFNVNIFAKASAKNFQKASESAGGISSGLKSSGKEAKQLNKQLAGFDEMNVLQDNKQTSPGTGGTGGAGGTGGGGSIPVPSMDLSKIDQDTQKIADKLKKTADDTVSFWEEDWKWWFDNADGNWSLFIQGLLLTLEGFYLTFKGTFDILGGLLDILIGIFTGDEDKIKEGWDKMCKGLGELINGLVDIVIGLIGTLVGLVLGLVLDLWDGIVYTFSSVGSWVNEHIIQPVIKFVKDLWNNIKKGASSFWEGIKSIFGKIGTWVNDHVVKPVKEFFSNLWSNIKKGAKTAIDNVINFFKNLPNNIKGIIDKVVNFFKNLGKKIGDATGNAFKTAINGALTIVENILNTPIKLINKLLNVINKVPGINLPKLETFKLPRLKSGAILNQPGKGVLVGSGKAIAGEAGREGYIPLTDSQAMAQLGAEIGRNVVINLTNITRLDNRQIAREQKLINAQSDFAFNR